MTYPWEQAPRALQTSRGPRETGTICSPIRGSYSLCYRVAPPSLRCPGRLTALHGYLTSFLQWPEADTVAVVAVLTVAVAASMGAEGPILSPGDHLRLQVGLCVHHVLPSCSSLDRHCPSGLRHFHATDGDRLPGRACDAASWALMRLIYNRISLDFT